MQFPARTGPITNDQAPFTVSMVQSVLPTSPLRFRSPRFQPDLPPQVNPFSVEMSQGCLPVAPRLLLGQRIDLPISQTTHVPAAFSSEMAAGAQGLTWPSPRLHRGIRIPLPIAETTPTAAPLSVEMTAGWQPTNPRLSQGKRLEQFQLPEIAAFSIEMVQGWHPDRPTLRLAPRIGLPISQTTHDQAPFVQAMVQSELPAKHRHRQAPRIPMPLWSDYLGSTPTVTIVADGRLVVGDFNFGANITFVGEF